MARTLVASLGAAIGYPEPIDDHATEWILRVDGGRFRAWMLRGRLLVSHLLEVEEEDLGKLAGFAVGRFFHDNAVLSWDAQGGTLSLWQELPSTSDAEALSEAFGAFVDACDWWRERIAEFRTPSPLFSPMVINP